MRRPYRHNVTALSVLLGLVLPTVFIYCIWLNMNESSLWMAAWLQAIYAPIAIFGILQIFVSLNKRPEPVLHMIEIKRLGNARVLAVLISNQGASSLEKDSVHLHLRVPRRLDIQYEGVIKNDHGNFIIPGKKQTPDNTMIELGMTVPARVFPGRKCRIYELKLILDKKSPGVCQFEYFISSEYGYRPKKLVLTDEGEPTQNLGKISYDTESGEVKIS